MSNLSFWIYKNRMKKESNEVSFLSYD